MPQYQAYTEKVSIADNDLFLILDSVGNVTKKVKYSTLRDFGALGIKSDKVEESTAAAGVTIIGSGGLKTNKINERNANMTIAVTGTGRNLSVETLDSDLIIQSGLNLNLAVNNGGDLNIDIAVAGIIKMNGANTYTGTLAGAAGKSVVNGLIMD